MSRQQHFFVLYRPAEPDHVWPVEELSQRVALLRLHPLGNWHMNALGPLLVGWLGNAVDTSVPFLLHAGYLAEPENAKAGQPELAATLAAETPPDFPLDGTFAACAVDPERRLAMVCNDHFGLFPLYCHDHQGTYCFATSLSLLAALTRPTCELNRSAVYEMIGFHLVLGNRTFLREINLVAPATVVRLQGREPTRSTYWDWHRLAQGAGSADAATSRDYVGKTYSLIEKAVLRSVRGAKRIALGLSGGLDSRMLAAVLARNKVPCQAYNMNFGRETAIAQQVADALKIPLRVMPMLPTPGRTLLSGHDAMDCLYNVHQAWGFDMAEHASRDGCDLFLDGLAFDTILGSVHRVVGDDAAALAAGLQGNYREIDVETLGRVTGVDAAKEMQQTLDSAMLAMARECLENAGEWASEYFVMTNRIRKYTFAFGLANLYNLPGAFPYVTRELFEHCMRLPLEERRYHRLYRRIYVELFPELAKIPWAKTNLPLDQYGSPPEQTPARKLLGNALRRLSFGRLHFPGEQTLDDQFRTRQELREPFLQRLSETGRLQMHRCIPEQTIPNALRSQYAGRNYFVLLESLFTVENFLARMVKEGNVTIKD